MSLIPIPTKQSMEVLHSVVRHLPAADKAELTEDLGLDADYQDFLKARQQIMVLLTLASLVLVLYIILMITELR